MKKFTSLMAVAVAGILISGCAEFKLPELPKLEKKENKKLTEKDCEKIMERYYNITPGELNVYEKGKFDAQVTQCQNILDEENDKLWQEAVQDIGKMK